MNHQKLNRRTLLKYGGALGSTFFLNQMSAPSLANAFNRFSSLNRTPGSDGPIQWVSPSEFFSQDFNGDEMNNSHKILWNIEEYIRLKGGLPPPEEYAPVVVVGGGMSGLLSAYYQKNQNPIVLESDSFFGGNSKGEAFQRTQYSIGAAYITLPEAGSAIQKLLIDLNLTPYIRQEKSDETLVRFQNQFFKGFWEGASDPTSRQEFLRIYQSLKEIYTNSYPEIPMNNDSTNNNLVVQWDQLNFEEWMQKNWGEVHPHIKEYFQLYCWSSFGGSTNEISAAQALNFLTAETDSVLTFPGGNSAITHSLYNHLNQFIKPNSLRSRSMVVDISELGTGLRVTYADFEGNLHCIQTDKCIVASSKMIAKRIIKHMPLEQIKACDELVYRPYIVANVFIEKPFNSPCFDLYCLTGEVPEAPSAMNPPKRPFTDVCFGSWAQGDNTDYSILTIYKPLPYQGARQFLFSEQSHQKYQKVITDALGEFLPHFNVRMDQVRGLRLTRWGHSMPLAYSGLISSGVLEKARAPINGKIFFANQDNWANPSFETAIASALEVSGLS